MKKFKTMTIAILILGLICFPLRASAISEISTAIDAKQQEIDALFTELNELAAAEYFFIFCK